LKTITFAGKQRSKNEMTEQTLTLKLKHTIKRPLRAFLKINNRENTEQTGYWLEHGGNVYFLHDYSLKLGTMEFSRHIGI